IVTSQKCIVLFELYDNSNYMQYEHVSNVWIYSFKYKKTPDKGGCQVSQSFSRLKSRSELVMLTFFHHHIMYFLCCYGFFSFLHFFAICLPFSGDQLEGKSFLVFIF